MTTFNNVTGMNETTGEAFPWNTTSMVPSESTSGGGESENHRIYQNGVYSLERLDEIELKIVVLSALILTIVLFHCFFYCKNSCSSNRNEVKRRKGWRDSHSI